MIGGGFINEMRKTMERNRSLLNRKSLKDKLDEYGKTSGRDQQWEDKPATKHQLEDIRTRVAQQRKEALKRKVILLVIVIIGISAASWTLLNSKFENDPTPMRKVVGLDKEYFFSRYVLVNENKSLKIDYTEEGSKVSETEMVNGVKHGESVSYYASGELLRRAEYSNGKLISEWLYFKSGEPITDFESGEDDWFRHLVFRTADDNWSISFDYWDGKVIPGSYQEYNLMTEEIRR